MKKKIIFIAILLFIIATAIQFFHYNNESLEEANESYLIGEKSSLPQEKEIAFNKSLEKFLYLEKKYQPIYGDGKLYYDIANCYFQLSEYPMAALYYYKALFLRPLDNYVFENLNITLKKLNLPIKEEDTFLKKIFFFHNLIALPQKLQIFSLIMLLFWISLSFYLWRPSLLKRNVSISFFILSFVLFLSLAFSYFYEYSEGVLMKASYFYKGEGNQFSKVIDNPLQAGSKIRIIESNLSGNWLKIEDQEGKVGFIESEKVRLIF